MSTRRKPYTLEEWSDTNAKADQLRELAETADKANLEEAAEMLWRMAGEYDDEAEHIQIDLISRGIEP